MSFDPLNIRLVLQQYVSQKIEKSVGQLGLGPPKVEAWSDELRNHYWIVITQPVGVELGGVPSPGNEGLRPLTKGCDDVKKDASAITSTFITAHLTKRVLTGWQSDVRSLSKHRDGPRFCFCHLRKQVM